MPQTNAKGPWSWGCAQGISVDAAREPSAGYPAAEVVKNPNVTPQSPTLTFSPENWYFAK
jgi:hypothetical protein